MVYGDRRYRRIRLSIHPRAPFRSVLSVLDRVNLPELGMNPEHIKYAVLEMVNNSLRAHRAVGLDGPIAVEFELGQEALLIRISDDGPGFDPSCLPYRLDADPQSIDLNSEAFQEYRRRNNYQRFGMGLPLVLRTFDTFSVDFRDAGGQPVTWGDGKVHGTSITVTKGRHDGE